MQNQPIAFESNPLLVSPRLAAKIGLVEAIILQQFHYWNTKGSGRIIDGVRWIWNSLDSWLEQFPFLTKWQLRQAINHLRELKLIEFERHEKHRWNQTGWYAIAYDRLKPLLLSMCGIPHIDMRPTTHRDVDCPHIRSENSTENSSKISLSPLPPSEEEREGNEQKCPEEGKEPTEAESPAHPLPLLKDRKKPNEEPKDLSEGNFPAAAVSFQNSDKAMECREWEIAPGEPYPAFLKWRAQHYIDQGGHWAKAAEANARSEFRNNPSRASDLLKVFLPYANQAADVALANKEAGIAVDLPPCFRDAPPPQKEEIMAKLALVVTATPATATLTPPAVLTPTIAPTSPPNAENVESYQLRTAEDFATVPKSAPPEGLNSMLKKIQAKLAANYKPAKPKAAAANFFGDQDQPPTLTQAQKFYADPLLKAEITRAIAQHPEWDLEIVGGEVREIPF